MRRIILGTMVAAIALGACNLVPTEVAISEAIDRQEPVVGHDRIIIDAISGSVSVVPGADTYLRIAATKRVIAAS